MPLSGAILGGLIETNLAADGAIGPKLATFSLAVGNGVVNALEGIAFSTTDVGFIGFPPGTGSGIGITGLVPANMVSLASSQMISLGPKAPTFFLAIMNAVSAHLLSDATLSSIDPDVTIGTGTIQIGSFVVTVPQMQATILSALQADGAIGPNLSNLCLSIAYGVVTELLTVGTGTLVITGDPSSTPNFGLGIGTLT